jgi:IS4 transposase
LGRIHYRDPETGKEYVFPTSGLDLPALEVAKLYRRRWQIELCCKWIEPAPFINFALQMGQPPLWFRQPDFS